MCSIVDLEPCSVWQETNRTARKAHRCDACRGPIAPGDRYVDHFSVFEGEMSRQKMCAACDAARDEFGKAHELQPRPRDLVEMFAECIGQGDDGDDPSRWVTLLHELRSRKE